MYFFDTYALIEIIEGNRAYESFANVTIKTSALNLGELYYIILNRFNKQTAEYWQNKFNDNLIDISEDVIKEAASFRHTHKKRKLSFIDCIGYILAQENNLRFLTGDKGFKDIEGVEFVK